MFELARHIETLLLDNDCVILPQFGGFVAYNTPAKWCEDEFIFLPPTRVIGFNPQLRMNDGLLVQSYMKVYDTNFSDATKILEGQINQLIEKIHEDGRVEFENIGELSYSVQGSFTFVSFDNKLASPSFYGLDTFEFPELKAIPQVVVDKKFIISNPVIKKANKEINTSFPWRNVAAIAAISIIAVFLFFISTPVENTYVEKGNYAQIFPSEIINRLDKNSLLTTYVDLGNSETRIIEEIKNETEEEKEEPTPEIIISENVPSEITVPVQEPEITVSKPTRSFNIIAASVPYKNEAEKIVKRLKSEGYPETKIITGNGKFRVSIKSFSTREEAETELSKLRKNPSYQSSWLLIK